MPIAGRAAVLALGGPALLLVGALLPGVRPAVALVVAGGWLALAVARRPEALGWAAALPLALSLTWPWVLGADVPLGEAGCTDPLSVIALRRVAALAVVVAAVGALATVHGGWRRSLGVLALRRPGVGEAGLAAAGAVVLAVGGLVIGPLVAEPFFGRLDFPRPVGAIVPALVFGIANGVLEELAYRGALQGWLGLVVGRPAAIAFQGLVFGIVHVGPEVVSLVPVHVALLAAVGIAGGLVVDRTRSLAIPVGIHVGADVALYVGLACRAAG